MTIVDRRHFQLQFCCTRHSLQATECTIVDHRLLLPILAMAAVSRQTVSDTHAARIPALMPSPVRT